MALGRQGGKKEHNLVLDKVDSRFGWKLDDKKNLCSSE